MIQIHSDYYKLILLLQINLDYHLLLHKPTAWVVGAIRHSNIYLARGAPCQFHNIIAFADFAVFLKVFICRGLAFICKLGARNALPMLITVQANVDKICKSRLYVVDAIYNYVLYAAFLHNKAISLKQSCIILYSTVFFYRYYSVLLFLS